MASCGTENCSRLHSGPAYPVHRKIRTLLLRSGRQASISNVLFGGKASLRRPQNSSRSVVAEVKIWLTPIVISTSCNVDNSDFWMRLQQSVDLGTTCVLRKDRSPAFPSALAYAYWLCAERLEVAWFVTGCLYLIMVKKRTRLLHSGRFYSRLL